MSFDTIIFYLNSEIMKEAERKRLFKLAFDETIKLVMKAAEPY